jgi:hypothetical protein
MKESFDSSIGNNITGFIQAIGIDPFYVLFYTEDQIKTYIGLRRALQRWSPNSTRRFHKWSNACYKRSKKAFPLLIDFE